MPELQADTEVQNMPGAICLRGPLKDAGTRASGHQLHMCVAAWVLLLHAQGHARHRREGLTMTPPPTASTGRRDRHPAQRPRPRPAGMVDTKLNAHTIKLHQLD
jgi:hypothetical protein